jgi:hypothetical protein
MSHRRRQGGVIFLALALVLVVGGGAFVLSALNNRQSAVITQQAELRRQMQLAKSNLLAYLANGSAFYADAAATDDQQGPGFFPCPDTDDPADDADGLPDSTCNPTNTTLPACNSNTSRPGPRVGRLPKYIDAAGERFVINDYYDDPNLRFWYVVAPRYIYNSTTTSGTRFARHRTSTSTTVSTPGPACMRMYLDDNPEYVALIIAPGEELETQDRQGNATLYANYLDGQNGANNYYYSTSYPANPALFNDQIIGITLDEYIATVGMRVAVEMQKQLDGSHGAAGSYPANLSAFRALLDDTSDLVWLMPNSTTDYNGERWSTNANAYSKVDADNAIISFNGCSGITFQFVYPGRILRSGDSC